jgi:hypothetical protein
LLGQPACLTEVCIRENAGAPNMELPPTAYSPSGTVDALALRARRLVSPSPLGALDTVPAV